MHKAFWTQEIVYDLSEIYNLGWPHGSRRPRRACIGDLQITDKGVEASGSLTRSPPRPHYCRWTQSRTPLLISLKSRLFNSFTTEEYIMHNFCSPPRSGGLLMVMRASLNNISSWGEGAVALHYKRVASVERNNFGRVSNPDK